MLTTYRGLSQHTQHCNKRINVVPVSSSQSVTMSKKAEVTNAFSPVPSFMLGERDEISSRMRSMKLMRK